MRSVEGEGSTIDDAIARALAALGVARDQAEIDILWNASRGVLGIGRRKARVRATIRARLDLIAAARAEEDPAPSITTSPAAPSRAVPPATSVARDPGVEGGDILREILRRMQLTVSVVESGSPDERALRLEGPDASEAIGHRGEVLDALEYLVNRIAERGGGARGRVVLDAAGFRERRQAGLVQRAHRLAERARTRRKPIATNPLSPEDRRAMYLALKLENGVVARSVGQGVYRKLVIIPEDVRRSGGKATQ